MAQSLHSSNYLLASLHADKMAALLPHLKVVELPQETVLYESGDTIKAVYSPRRGDLPGRRSRFRRHDRGRHGRPGQRRRRLFGIRRSNLPEQEPSCRLPAGLRLWT